MKHKAALPIIWRLHTVMSERGIRTATELYRRLEPYGISITSAQLSRIVSKMPQRLNTQVLAALMTELDCEATDFVRKGEATEGAVVARPAARPATKPAARAKAPAKKAAKPQVPADVLGPSVTTLASRRRRDKT